MVSLRKICRAPFVANEFVQISKRPSRSLEQASGSHALIFSIFEESCLVAEIGRFVISGALFCVGMEIVGPLNIFMDPDSLFTDGDIGRMLVDPGSAVEIIDSVFVLVQGGMSVAAENPCRLMVAGMSQRALGDLLRQALPARAQPVEETRHGLV